jgi:hypothetical protein
MGKQLCIRCHAIGEPKRQGGMGFGGAILLAGLGLGGFAFSPLWLGIPILLVVDYSMVKPGCRACGSQEMVPDNSPRAQEIIRQKAHDRVAS